MPRNDIFLSYRRNGGFDTAKHLYDLLIRDGYTVSFDIDTLRNGNFDNSLYRRIDECKDFILIINDNAFEKTLDPSTDPNEDWMRQELSYALKQDKNIIPIFLRGITSFPKNLPDDIKGVIYKNGPRYDEYFFDAFYNKLKLNFLISKPRLKKFKIKTLISAMVGGFIAILVVLLLVLKFSPLVLVEDKPNLPQDSINTTSSTAINQENTDNVLPNFSPSEFKSNTLVDMGLSVLWYSQNVGETIPSGATHYYGWGAKTTANSGTDYSLYKYETLPLSIVGNTKYDVAASLSVSDKSLRMPTEMELEQLLNQCIWEMGYLNGQIGYKVTGKKKRNSIFIPASGYYNKGYRYNHENSPKVHCLYWSGTLASKENKAARALDYRSGSGEIVSVGLENGFLIRPVSDK